MNYTTGQVITQQRNNDGSDVQFKLTHVNPAKVFYSNGVKIPVVYGVRFMVKRNEWAKTPTPIMQLGENTFNGESF